MSVIIGLDCGGITRKSEKAHAGTGLAVLSTDNGRIELLEARQVLWDEWTLGQMLQDYEARYEPDKIVYESFTPRWGVPFSLDPVYLIGSLKSTIVPTMLHGVQPSAHKSLIKRDWAKSLVLEAGFKVLDGHCVDAVSLCLYYGMTNQDETIQGEYKKWLKSR